MKKILHIVASPRGDQSRTLKISDAYLKAVKERNPEVEIEVLDVFRDNIPELSVFNVRGELYPVSRDDMSDEEKQSEWKHIEAEITRFKSADHIVISSPMWNFSLPYKLKQYIDLICQAGHTFNYTENGPVGLMVNTSLMVVSTRGGDYSEEGGLSHMDYLKPYLNQIADFLGFKDVKFVSAEPLDMAGPEVTEEKVKVAIEQVTAQA